MSNTSVTEYDDQLLFLMCTGASIKMKSPLASYSIFSEYWALDEKSSRFLRCEVKIRVDIVFGKVQGSVASSSIGMKRGINQSEMIGFYDKKK